MHRHGWVKRSIWRDEAVIASLGNSWTLNRVTYGLLTFRNIIFKQLYHQLLLFIHVRPTTHRRRQHHDRSPIHLLPQTTRRSHTISQHLTLPVCRLYRIISTGQIPRTRQLCAILGDCRGVMFWSRWIGILYGRRG
jgi:hypothetical protein